MEPVPDEADEWEPSVGRTNPDADVCGPDDVVAEPDAEGVPAEAEVEKSWLLETLAWLLANCMFSV